MRIRPYQSSDAAALLDIFNSAVHITAAPYYSLAQRQAWAPAGRDFATWQARMNAMQPWVLEQGGQMLGYASLESSGYIDHFFVRGGQARQGLGTALMQHLLALAQTRHLPQLSADVSLAAQPFFAHHGFVLVEHRMPVRAGIAIPNALMRKPLLGTNCHALDCQPADLADNGRQRIHHREKSATMTTSLRPLGRSPLQVSPLCFGGNVFGWTADEATSFSLLDAWLDAGMNFVDTADVYSRWAPGHQGGESESVIGKWLRKSGKRHQLVLATKVGKDMGDGKVGLRPQYIREAVDASLQRLQTDYIDLYQSHDDDPNVPLEDVMGTFGELIQQGKVRAVGASNYSAARLAEALQTSEKHRLTRYESLQPLYNLYDRAVFEKELQPLCVQNQVGVINFYSLAAGFVTGKYRTAADASKSPRGAKTTSLYLNERGLGILTAMEQVAQRLGAELGEVAVAWVMRQPGISSPIASASNLQQLQSLLKASRLQLDDAAMATLNAASAEA